MRIAGTSPGTERGALRFVPRLGLLFAGVAVALLALVPAGWRLGWWPYRFSLLTLMPWAAYFGVAAVAVAALALVIAASLRSAIGRCGIAIAVLAALAGGITAYAPWHYRALARSVPPIDDVTTDTVNPPAFVAVLKARAAEGGNPASYSGGRASALQKRAYPDLVPLSLALPPDKAFALALATAKKLGWTIVAADPAAGHIEATDRTFWMGFVDDIAVRVAKSEGGSRIDLRSASRHGRSDLGVNADRIRRYLAALREAQPSR